MITLAENAITLATRYHAGQKRKWGNPPADYITHPLSAALLSSQFTSAPGAIEAMICHDLLEDTDCTTREIENAIGYFGAMYVEELTDVKIPGLKRAAQKRSDRERLSKCRPVTKILKICDRLHNLMTLETAPAQFQELYMDESRKLFEVLKDSLPAVLQYRLKTMLGGGSK